MITPAQNPQQRHENEKDREGIREADDNSPDRQSTDTDDEEYPGAETVSQPAGGDLSDTIRPGENRIYQ
jgi:hypothetical protein